MRVQAEEGLVGVDAGESSSVPALNVETLMERLEHMSVPSRLLYLPEVGSTNRVLAELPGDELAHGVAAIAEYQSAGRGRHSRRWEAPAGSSVLMSVALETPAQTSPTDVLLATVLAVGDAIQRVVALQATLKWPNDVLLGGKKTCGILAESTRRSRAMLVVVGIGLNVNVTNAELSGLGGWATSLSIEAGTRVSRERIVVGLFESLNMWYGCLQRDPYEVFASWKERLDTLGRRIEIQTPTESWQGVALDVQRDGGLVVRTDGGGERVVYAADVSVRQR